MLSRILGIDPSINHTGYGLIFIEKVKVIQHMESGVILLDPSMQNSRYAEIAKRLWEVINIYFHDPTDRDLIAIERPHFEPTSRGYDCIGQKTHGILKLSIVTGIAVALAAIKKVPCTLISASQWKRGVTKPRMKARVHEIFPGKKFGREDEWEALGIALWANRHRKKLEIISA